MLYQLVYVRPVKKRDLYLKVAEAILVQAGVEQVVYVDRSIRAYAAKERRGAKRRFIVTSVPSTPARLLTIAHEAAHVYFRHGRAIPRHREEFEAENYSYATLRRYGVEFDEEKHALAGKRYVARSSVPIIALC